MSFAPLYPPGIHDISIDSMDDIFVHPFANNKRRKYLTERFRAFLDKFAELGLYAEIWIDGSFSTQKPEPGDIDVVFFLDAEQINNLEPDKRNLIAELFNNADSKIRYQCDVYLVPIQDPDSRSYWRGWFGYSRDETPKGIIRIFYAIN